MEPDRIELKVLAPALTGVLAIEAVLIVLGPEDHLGRLVWLGIGRLLAAGLLLFVAVKWGGGWGSVGLNREQLRLGWKKGLLWTAGFGSAAAAGAGLGYLFGGDPAALVRMPLPQGGLKLVIFFIVGGLAAPVAEEIFFRGVIYGCFRRWGPVPALILSTLAFVLAHQIRDGWPFNQLIGGIVFALAYELTGSLMTPITIHVLGNLALFGLALIIR